MSQRRGHNQVVFDKSAAGVKPHRQLSTWSRKLVVLGGLVDEVAAGVASRGDGGMATIGWYLVVSSVARWDRTQASGTIRPTAQRTAAHGPRKLGWRRWERP